MLALLFVTLYGLGNVLYFPFGVGATTVLFPGPPTAPNVFRYRLAPTVCAALGARVKIPGEAMVGRDVELEQEEVVR